MEQIYKKIRAIQELFGDREVLLPVTFRICGDNITADIKQFMIANETAKDAEPEISKNDSREQLSKMMNKYVNDSFERLGSFDGKMLEGRTVLGTIAKENEDADKRPCVSASEGEVKTMDKIAEVSATLGSVAKWTDKLPSKFITLAVRYNGMNRFVYHTLHNEGGIIKAQWKNTLTGELETWSPYITVREYAHGSMNYLMHLCNADNTADSWRDFDVFKIAPGNWNSVVKETLITDPKAEEYVMTIVVYDIYMKSMQLIHFNEEEVGAVLEAIAKAEEDGERHFPRTYPRT